MKTIHEIVKAINAYHKEELVPEHWYVSKETGRVFRASLPPLPHQTVRLRQCDVRTYYKRYVPQDIKEEIAEEF